MDIEARPSFHPAATAFIDPAAVEAWDAWFRWREGNDLRDVTVDATWLRVTRALVAIDPAAQAPERQRLADAIAQWRLLVDPRILAGAGTPGFAWPQDDVTLALNLARFVAAPYTARAAVQAEALRECVGSALRVFDTLRAVAGAPTPGHGPRLTVVGLADALALLHRDYRGADGRACAADFLAEITAALAAAPSALPRPRLVLASQPQLAQLANNVADGAAPLRGATAAGAPSGYAWRLWRALHPGLPASAFPARDQADAGLLDQLALRAALQPWCAEPIAAPLPLPAAPAQDELAAASRYCVVHGLAAPQWTLAGAPRT